MDGYVNFTMTVELQECSCRKERNFLVCHGMRTGLGHASRTSFRYTGVKLKKQSQMGSCNVCIEFLLYEFEKLSVNDRSLGRMSVIPVPLT